MAPPAHRPTTVRTLLLVGIAALLWVAWGAQLVMQVPGYEHRAADMNLKLPPTTEAIFSLARWVNNYWYVLPLVGLPILAVVLLISSVVQRRAGWGTRVLWFLLLLGLPVAGQVLTWLSIRHL